jgi:hypothetical protein
MGKKIKIIGILAVLLLLMVLSLLMSCNGENQGDNNLPGHSPSPSSLPSITPSITPSPTPTAEVLLKWQRCYGGSGSEIATFIRQTSDDGYIIAGYSNSNNETNGDVTDNHGKYDFWILKLDNYGDIEWKKCLGGTENDKAHFSIQQTADGGYIVAGESASNDGDILFDNNGGIDFWVIRLDSNGNPIWKKCYGGSGNEYAQSILQTSDGGYVIVGQANSSNGDVTKNNGGNDYWVVKIDGDGLIEWQGCYGGSGNEYPKCIRQTSDNGYIIVGHSDSNDIDVFGNHGGFDIWALKLSPPDPSSPETPPVIEWQRCIGGSLQDYAYSVYQNAKGEYLIAGHSNSIDGDIIDNKGANDFLVLKLKTDGKLAWIKNFGGSNEDYAQEIFKTDNGGSIITGWTNSNDGDVKGSLGNIDYWAVKISSKGNIEWARCFGGSGDDYGKSVAQTSDKGYVIAGYSFSIDLQVTGNHGDSDYWVIKMGNLPD